GLMPDSDFRYEPIVRPPVGEGREPIGPAAPQKDEDQEQDSNLGSMEQTHTGPQDKSLENTVGGRENVESAIDEVHTIRFGMDVLTDTEVRWPLTIKGNPHLLIAGLPGMGKTTCLLNLCKQMIGAGIRPIVFSYHQDIDERLQHLVDSVR